MNRIFYPSYPLIGLQKISILFIFVIFLLCLAGPEAKASSRFKSPNSELRIADTFKGKHIGSNGRVVKKALSFWRNPFKKKSTDPASQYLENALKLLGLTAAFLLIAGLCWILIPPSGSLILAVLAGTFFIGANVPFMYALINFLKWMIEKGWFDWWPTHLFE